MGNDASKPMLSKSFDRQASRSSVVIKLTSPESISSSRSSLAATSADHRRLQMKNTNHLSIDSPSSFANRKTTITTDDCPSMHSSTSSTNADSRKSSSASRRSQSQHLSRKQSTASTNSADRPKHPLPLKSRQLIKSCLLASGDTLGRRIYKKATQRRSDFGRFFASLTEDEQLQMHEAVKVFLRKTAANIDFIDEVGDHLVNDVNNSIYIR